MQPEDFQKFFQGNFANIFEQAQQQMHKQQEELKNTYVEGNSGGGKVTVTINGHQQLIKIRIDPEIISSDPEDVELLEDMITAAVNQAIEKSKKLAGEELSKLTGGMNLGNIMDMFKK